MKKGSFGWFLGLMAVYGILGSFIGYLLPFYFKEIGFTGFQIGIYFSVISAASLLFCIPMGVTGDRTNIVPLLIISLVLMGLRFLGFLISDAFVVLALFALIGSFGSRFFSISIDSFFFKTTGNDNTREAGLFQFVKFGFNAIGMLAGAYIVTWSGYKNMFIMSMAGYWVLGCLALMLPKTEGTVVKAVEYKKDLFQPKVLFLTFIFFLLSLHWGAEVVAYAPFIKNQFNLNVAQVGWYTSIGHLVVGAGAYLGHILLSRRLINTKNLLVLGFVLSGLFHILMCIPVLELSFLFRMIHEIGDGFIFLCFYHGIANIFHVDRIGGCSSFISLWMGIGSIISAAVFGTMVDRLGAQWPLMISGIILLASSAMLIKANDKREILPSMAPSPVKEKEAITSL